MKTAIRTISSRLSETINPDYRPPLTWTGCASRCLKPAKPGTVKNVLELLRRLVNFATKKHLCPSPFLYHRNAQGE